MELVEGPEHLETDALKTNGADVLPVNGLVCLLTVVLVGIFSCINENKLSSSFCRCSFHMSSN